MAGSIRKYNILVTGGAGFIGTHTVVRLLKKGFKVSIIDNLVNAPEASVRRTREIVGSDLSQDLDFHLGDIRDKNFLEKIFSENHFHAVIHLAGLKGVGESLAKPLLYYNNNILGSLLLCETMAKFGCKKLVFSSSATVYGEPDENPCEEDAQLRPMHPYGRTKLFFEEMARDIQRADPEWRIILLRYFNPVGAHPSGRIGDYPKGTPDSLMPIIHRVAVRRLLQVNVYGIDYNTNDGTGVRDYIHVMDLADGHIAALCKLLSTEEIGCTAYNLGTGVGTTVLQMVAAFQRACDKRISFRLCERRPRDAGEVYASTEKAEKELGWKAKYGIDEICRDQWNWAKNNPWGYLDNLP